MLKMSLSNANIKEDCSKGHCVHMDYEKTDCMHFVRKTVAGFLSQCPEFSESTCSMDNSRSYYSCNSASLLRPGA